MTVSGSTTYKNICPTGWHVPTDTEWTTLTDYLGGLSSGGKMKSIGDNTAGTGLWNSPNTGADNLSGFTALPGGIRTSNNFSGIRNNASFWSTTEYLSNEGWNRELSKSNTDVDKNDRDRFVGSSVRCLRD